MAQQLTEIEIKNLYWQCEFTKVNNLIENYFCDKSVDQKSDKSIRLRTFHARALFEMHRLADVKKIYSNLLALDLLESDDYLYSVACFYYHDEQYEKSEVMLTELVDRCETLSVFHKAKLAIANIYITQKKYKEYSKIVSELEELYDVIALDEQIIYLEQKANAKRLFESKLDESKEIFCKIISLSIKNNWNYFIIRSLEGMAQIYDQAGNSGALEATLEILKCYLKPDETRYLQYKINKKYKDKNLTLISTIQFDYERKRICVQKEWVPLHDKPLLFLFLKILNDSGRFMSKSEIADQLWPDQLYLARIHDPRIFDIAKRVRMMIEPYENQPVSLLSSRLGYKLAGSSGSESSEPSSGPRKA